MSDDLWAINKKLQKEVAYFKRFEIPQSSANPGGGCGIISVTDYGAKGDGASDDTLAIQAAFAAMDAGDTLCFPHGVYLISNTLNFRSKNYCVIQGNQSTIKTKTGINFTNKALVDFAGSGYLHIKDLIIQSTVVSNQPLVGLAFGRIGGPGGGFNLLENVNVSGYFTFASVYDIGAEISTFLHCVFESDTVNPAYYTSGDNNASLTGLDTGVSNTCKRFYSCWLANFSGTADQYIVLLTGVTSEVVFRDCYFALSAQGRGVTLEVGAGGVASTYGLMFSNIRIEGTNSVASALLYDDQGFLIDLFMEQINYTMDDGAIVETVANGTVNYAHLDFMYPVGAGVMLISTNSAWDYCTVTGKGNGKIELNAGADFHTSYLVWFGTTSPFTGAGFADAYARNDIIWNQMSGYQSESGAATSRKYGGAIGDAGATPSVAGMGLISLRYSAPATLTNFTNPIPGQTIHLVDVFGNITIQNNANIHLAGSVNFVMTANSTLTLIWYDALSAWHELGRSVH